MFPLHISFSIYFNLILKISFFSLLTVALVFCIQNNLKCLPFVLGLSLRVMVGYQIGLKSESLKVPQICWHFYNENIYAFFSMKRKTLTEHILFKKIIQDDQKRWSPLGWCGRI